MRVLFVQTNTYRLLTPLPLGATLVAARLRRDGHEIRFVDLWGERHPLAAVREAARSFRPELACYSIRNRDNMDEDDYFDPIPGVAQAIAAVREVAPAPVLLGGTAFTTYPDRLLDATGAEWGIAGDDLEPIAHFVQSIAAGAPDLATPGLVYRNLGRRDAASCSQKYVTNPFTLVGYAGVRFDNYDLIDHRRYRWGHWQAGVVTRTGCPERCVYCDSFYTYGREFVLRDPAEVAADVLALKRTRRIRGVYLVDNAFNRHLDHAKEILRQILRQGAQVQLFTSFDPGHCDREFIDLYRRAGATGTMIFAESLSDPVLRELGKSFTVADVAHDTELFREARLAFVLRPTFGNPGETPDTVAETFRQMTRLKPTMQGFRIGWRIQPRTPLFRRAVAEGLLTAADDCYDARYYISPATPKNWLKRQILIYRLRHPLAPLRFVPVFLRAFRDLPFLRGPELVEDAAGRAPE